MLFDEVQKLQAHLLEITRLRFQGLGTKRDHWSMERHTLACVQVLGTILGPPANDRINPKRFVEEMIELAATALAAAQSEFVMAYGGLPKEESPSGV